MTQVICDEYYECEGCKWKYADKYDDIDEEYRHCPHLIEVAGVKHGKWIGEKHIILDTTSVYIKWKCSNCGVVAKRGLSYEDINNYAPSYLYCPECGAKMDLEENISDL